jgi:hypothetical protein
LGKKKMTDTGGTKKALDLSGVSLIAVDTLHPGLALWAMARCLDRARFAEALLVTRPDFTPPLEAKARGIRVVHTDAIHSIADYSRFMLTQLSAHTSGKHVLVVQWDGFIVHPECWDPEFLNFDYIGALWRRSAGEHRVGNGGFSLRSRKLIEAVERLAPSETHPEDAVIGHVLRDRLEREFAIRFPPPELAQKFAFERDRLDFASFGFHRYANFPLVLGADELREFLALAPDDVVARRGVSRLVRHCTERGMANVAREVLARRQRAGYGSAIGNAFMWAWTYVMSRRMPRPKRSLAPTNQTPD